MRATGVDGVGMDTGSDIGAVAAMLPARGGGAGQRRSAGAGGGRARRWRREAPRCCAAMRGRPFIFNLGHGIVPQTPPSMSRRCWSRCVPRKVAIVLFNLGGPDRPEAIRPFLLNLFRDPAILRVPFFVRPLLARMIARARGGAGEGELRAAGRQVAAAGIDPAAGDGAGGGAAGDADAKCFIAMRYWHPFSLEAARAVKAWGAGSGGAAAAVSALFHHHDRQFADRLAAGGGARRPGGADHDAVLLPD